MSQNDSVTIEYRTKKEYCSCCNQKLPEVSTSKIRKFEISKAGAKQWIDWGEAAEYPEDMERLVPEFVHETISFFATNSYEKIIVEDSEIERVRAFILNEVITQDPGEDEKG